MEGWAGQPLAAFIASAGVAPNTPTRAASARSYSSRHRIGTRSRPKREARAAGYRAVENLRAPLHLRAGATCAEA
jgi:hypothetical protein